MKIKSVREKELVILIFYNFSLPPVFLRYFSLFDM